MLIKEKDKRLHYAANLFIVLLVGCISFVCGLGWWSMLTGFGAAMLASLGKELYDHRPGGTGFDWRDILYDFYGQLTGEAMLSITCLIVV